VYRTIAGGDIVKLRNCKFAEPLKLFTFVSMIDPAIIREKYSSMTDEQLVHLAKEDSNGLTEEALAILKQEFEKRHLDPNAFIPMQNNEPDTDEEEREPIAGFYNPATSAEDALLGRHYLQIKNPAEEESLAKAEQASMVQLSTEEIHTRIFKCDRSMFINGTIAIAGIAITLITFFSVADTGGSFFVLWGAIAYGGFKFFRALIDKIVYKQLLKGDRDKKNESIDDK
jgi:hypothetical protein